MFAASLSFMVKVYVTSPSPVGVQVVENEPVVASTLADLTILPVTISIFLV